MFDIDGSHISALNDTDLRTLVARLCEAELRRAGLPVSAVTAGGDQNAADGGVDVRVDLPPSTCIVGFIPRAVTGFQVKVPDMPRQKILQEMCPKGIVRPIIEELASASGAYIIVSAKGSTTDRPYKARLKAMREAVADLSNSQLLALDFYDRGRLAAWVRDHPGIIAWVREKIGQPIRGWRPYANWAAPSEALDAEYLLDEKSRILDWRSPRDGPLAVEEGIRRIRQVLVNPKGVVRLVGLSGMGKTRLVQALFDERVSEQALDPTLVFYTDLAEQPEPSPRELLRHLIQNDHRAIVIVDNCPPPTHRALTAICTELGSTVSLLSVEYDVGDDDPEGSDVFRLEPASDDIIERLLDRRAPHVSQVDRRCIARFAGGNACIALALAHTVRRGESVANLTDRELFDRLFHQRRAQDEGIRRAAEACSLVYSFNGESLDGETAELPFLAQLARLTPEEVYRHVAELRSRGLVQHRAQWRAVLPQALANKLASEALQKIQPQMLASAFLDRASERLLRSFSRRLGYLHDCEAAQRIVLGWLSPGGPLSDLTRLTELDMVMFRNIAPVAPDVALDALERAANGENAGAFLDKFNESRSVWTSLLHSLAYDPKLFRRVALLLVRFVTPGLPEDRHDSAREALMGLFQLHLSGTHASVDQRLQLMDALIESQDEVTQTCGLSALDAALEAANFSSSHSFDFGARPRDYGWAPGSRDEIRSWYRAFVEYAQRIACSNSRLRDKARSILAHRFRDLWLGAGIVDELETTARAIAAQGFWCEGWISVCDTIRFDKRHIPPEVAGRLRALEELLRPADLLQTARAFVLSKDLGALGSAMVEPGEAAEDAASAFKRANEIAEKLGSDVAEKTEVLEVLLPDLVRGDNGRRWQFGRGLAVGAGQLPHMWRRLLDALTAVPERERNITVLRGFLQSAASRDTEATAGFLDDAVDDPVLGPWFPVLQTSIDIDNRGAERLEAAIQLGLAPSWTYQYLALGRATDPIPASTLQRLIPGVASLPNGYEVAADILGMRLHSTLKSASLVDKELIDCSRELVGRFKFERPGQMLDYHLAEIVDTCFAGSDAEEDARRVCRELRTAFLEHRAYSFDYPFLLKSLFRSQPNVALDEFLGDQEESAARSLTRHHSLQREGLLEGVPVESLIAWAQIVPLVRFPRLAFAITPFTLTNDKARTEWAPTALCLIDAAPNRVAVLTEFGRHMQPVSWSGSLADIIESRRALPRAFFDDPDPKVAAWARALDAEMARLAERDRLNERHVDESFE